MKRDDTKKNFTALSGNELATIIFCDCIFVSFRNLRIHQIAIGNGFVTCYPPYFSPNRVVND